MRHKCFLKWLVFAAEHTTSRCSSLFLVWCLVGSRRPEKQQAEPALRQPVEPQPQTWLLWDPHVGEFTCRRTASAFKPLLWWCLTPPLPPSFLQVRTLECIKHQAQQHDMTHLTDVVQRLALQSRTWTSATGREHVTTTKMERKKALLCFRKHFVYSLSVNICHHLLKCVTKPLTQNRNTGTKQARNHCCLLCSSCAKCNKKKTH